MAHTIEQFVTNLSEKLTSGDMPIVCAAPAGFLSRVIPMIKNQGELVELRFYVKAYEQGLIVSKPFGDNAKYDFIIDSGQMRNRVQVKSVGSKDTSSRANRYRIAATYGKDAKKLYTEKQIDCLAAYVIPLDVWYIIPVTELVSGSLSLFPHREKTKGYYEKYREAWDLF